MYYTLNCVLINQIHKFARGSPLLKEFYYRPPINHIYENHYLATNDSLYLDNKFSFELRYPVTTGQTATIYVFGFAEAGNNWNHWASFDPFNLFRAAGLGARVFTPAFGLIGINWAYGFDTVPGQLKKSGPQFHFSIGQQLR